MNNPELNNRDSYNVKELKDFFDTCKQEGISDKQAEKMAVALNKWDNDLIKAFVSNDENNSAITYNEKEKSKNEKVKNNREQLPALLMVIHHISLWFYIISIVSVTISLIGLISYNNSYGDSSSFVIAIVSLIIVLCVTGGIYYSSLFFYCKKLKKNPELQTGRIFSLINIAYSLITIVGSVVAVLIVIARYFIEKNYTTDDLYNSSVVYDSKITFDTEIFFIAISLIVIYSGVFLTYYATDFMKPYSIIEEDGTEKTNPKRIVIIISSIVATLTLLTTIITTAIFSLDSYAEDEKTVIKVTNIIETINEKVEETSTLPDSNEIQSIINDSTITYNPIDSYTYNICANFKTNTLRSYYYYYGNEDDTIESNRLYDLDSHNEGQHCYTIVVSEEYYMNNDFDFLDTLENEFNNSDLTVKTLNF